MSTITELECIDLADTTTYPPPLMRSPMKTACISPETIDEKLAIYVGQYGARWALIRCHMQKEFAISFPAKDLEKRWAALQERMRQASLPATLPTRSPLTRMELENQLEAPPVPKGIQERLPLRHVLPAAKAKRWREDGGSSPTQPTRPPPQPSPQRPHENKPLPECLKAGIPTFLLAPGSALAAPDSVRRQLKAVYLAARLTAQATEAVAANAAVAEEDAENATMTDGMSTVRESPSATHIFASEDEKVQIVQLLARELQCLKGKPGASASKSSRAMRSPKGPPKSPMAPPMSPKSPMSPSLLHAQRCRNAEGMVGSPTREAATMQLKKRWPAALR